MVKTAGIIAGIVSFAGKAWRVIRNTRKLKKEIVEAITEIKEFQEAMQSAITEIKSFKKEKSDGGKRITAKEALSMVDEIEFIIKKFSDAWKESLDAKNKIQELIKSNKK